MAAHLRLLGLFFLALSLVVGLYVVVFTIWVIGQAAFRSLRKRMRKDGSRFAALE